MHFQVTSVKLMILITMRLHGCTLSFTSVRSYLMLGEFRLILIYFETFYFLDIVLVSIDQNLNIENKWITITISYILLIALYVWYNNFFIMKDIDIERSFAIYCNQKDFVFLSRYIIYMIISFLFFDLHLYFDIICMPFNKYTVPFSVNN